MIATIFPWEIPLKKKHEDHTVSKMVTSDGITTI